MGLYRRVLPYGVAIGTTTIAFLLSLGLREIISPVIDSFFYIAIAISAWYGGFRPGIVAIVLSILAINYYFMSPLNQFQVASIDTLRLALITIVSLIITLLSSHLRESRQKVERLNRQLLEESTDRLHTALNAAQMGMWDWDMSTGKIIWSPEHEQLFNLAPGSFDGRYETFDACLYPNDRQGLNQAVERALHHRLPYCHEYRILWQDGSVHWIEGRGQALYNPAGQPVRMSGTVMAIDARKQAEIALQEQESLLRLFVQYAPAGIAMFDRQMCYVMASQRWVDEYHLGSVEALIHRSHYEIFPEIPERWRQIHQRCLAGAIEKADDDLFLRADGTSQWISWEIYPWRHATGEIGGIIIFSVDVTPRKQAELALQRLNAELEQRVSDRTTELTRVNDRLLSALQEQRQARKVLEEQAQLLDLAHDAIITLDLNWMISFWNQGAEFMYGWSQAEVVGKEACRLLQTQFPHPFAELKAELLAKGYWQGELIHTNRNGCSITVSSRWVLQTDEAGSPLKILEINNDITERKQVEQVKNEFIGIVSHELRTPLTAIQMSLGLLKTGIYDQKPDKFRRMIEIALLDTNRLVHLVNDILDLERLESGQAVLEKTLCLAADLIQQAIDGMQQIATQQQITLTPIPTQVEVWAAADAIVQTLTNLLSNAIKFSSPGSTVWVRAAVENGRCQGETVNQSPPDGISSSPPPPLPPSPFHILFSVQDQGRGIPTAKLESIFGRFQQVDATDSREKGGTGLGLAICRSIVERHGGKIWAVNNAGQGSTFFFTLPLSAEQNDL